MEEIAAKSEHDHCNLCDIVAIIVTIIITVTIIPSLCDYCSYSSLVEDRFSIPFDRMSHDIRLLDREE